MTYYAGLDVSLRSTHICVIDDDGELLAEGKTDSEVVDIIAFLDELDVEITEACSLPAARWSAWRLGKSKRRSLRCATRPTRTMPAALPSCSGAAGTAACM
jgi:hypothetical protein